MKKRTCIIIGILVFLLVLSLVGNYRLYHRFTIAKQAHGAAEIQQEEKVSELMSARAQWETLLANIKEVQEEYADLIAHEEEMLAKGQESMAQNTVWTLHEFRAIIDTYIEELSKSGLSEEEIAAVVDEQVQQWVMYSQEAFGVGPTPEPKTGSSQASQSATSKTARNEENTAGGGNPEWDENGIGIADAFEE